MSVGSAILSVSANCDMGKFMVSTVGSDVDAVGFADTSRDVEVLICAVIARSALLSAQTVSRSIGYYCNVGILEWKIAPKKLFPQKYDKIEKFSWITI